MKKIVIFVILCLLLTFVSCDSQVTNPTTTPTKTPVKTVAPTATPTKTPVKTVAPTTTPTKTPVKTAAPTSPPKSEQIVPSNLAVGNIVKFGFYEQDNDLPNGKEDIEWLVLDVKNGKALIISKYGLDCQPYHTTYANVTWETCTLRNWLNTTFYMTAFDAKQQSIIASTALMNEDNSFFGAEGGNDTTDKVFLLSSSETNRYFKLDTERKLIATAYSKAQGASVVQGGSIWWLRSPGDDGRNAAIVDYSGSADDYGAGVFADDYTVRPALWINLES